MPELRTTVEVLASCANEFPNVFFLDNEELRIRSRNAGPGSLFAIQHSPDVGISYHGDAEGPQAPTDLFKRFLEAAKVCQHDPISTAEIVFDDSVDEFKAFKDAAEETLRRAGEPAQMMHFAQTTSFLTIPSIVI
mmetsp:Transcript_9747/g.23275  ORF Transcript_9747/g.23275 Transcript_9747/m.23275 type:complete len:135 (-) Transcript_9747:600-1004(-)|eukprot:CAMPEP_0198308120 /NCGR_PEP_ID=MMETSP1450-20131203/889_1 /TAXON_ID=753684 ORGANISM="Madagascaria erythrocladiodes, Strain CCMP3234" /NCGR_SAMPLE_ID=MMETSP1450 /ASSEMBLY_ACC=CAM_ASM_001115 /LENGTH=134 /DNA_ID=CAMNT_0044010761 /DNA_START=111 /DNA_END=515 /DNA_ORIENTATION=+